MLQYVAVVSGSNSNGFALIRLHVQVSWWCVTRLIDSPSASCRGGMHISGSSVTQKNGNEPAGWCDHIGFVCFHGAAPLLFTRSSRLQDWVGPFFWNRSVDFWCVWSFASVLYRVWVLFQTFDTVEDQLCLKMIRAIQSMVFQDVFYLCVTVAQPSGFALTFRRQEPKYELNLNIRAEERSKCHSHGQSVKADLRCSRVVTTWIRSVFSVFSVQRVKILQCRISE